jgi:hypothetical protein
MPRVTLASWRRLTLSRHALILETSLSKPTELRLCSVSCYCLAAGKGNKVSQTVSASPRLSAGRRLDRLSKAQTFLLAAPGATPGTTNKIDQGRSLSLRAPQGCLRVWVRPTTSTPASGRLSCRTTWILPGPRQYTDASELTSSRLPTIHLSKSYVTKVLRHRPLRVRDVQLFSPPGSSQRSLPRSREAESYRSFRPCQSAPRRIFVHPSRDADRPVTNPWITRSAVQKNADANPHVRHFA